MGDADEEKTEIQGIEEKIKAKRRRAESREERERKNA